MQKDGKEYLWHGDSEYWGRRSPILFPMVGKVYGGVFRVDGDEQGRQAHPLPDLRSSSDLQDRYLNHSLKPGETFEFTYWVEL